MELTDKAVGVIGTILFYWFMIFYQRKPAEDQSRLKWKRRLNGLWRKALRKITNEDGSGAWGDGEYFFIELGKLDSSRTFLKIGLRAEGFSHRIRALQEAIKSAIARGRILLPEIIIVSDESSITFTFSNQEGDDH